MSNQQNPTNEVKVSVGDTIAFSHIQIGSEGRVSKRAHTGSGQVTRVSDTFVVVALGGEHLTVPKDSISAIQKRVVD